MSLLKPMTGEAGYLKAGLLGFQSSGKTRTAVELAIGTRAHFGLKEPIGFFDTESGSDYVRKLIEKRTGAQLLGIKSHSFSDLMQVAEESVGAVSVLIIDSITHIWREVCESYLAQVNDRLRRAAEKNRRTFYPRKKLEFNDWDPIKNIWTRWTNFYLNSPLHIVVCGRAGYDYDMQEDEEGKKKELVKTGIKMKAEGEFGYEPSLLVEMERIQQIDGPVHRLLHRATVIKDRSDVLNGRQAEDPGFVFFKPHLEFLNPSAHQPIDTARKTDHGVGGDGDDDWHREKRARTICAEEIERELVRAYPGQTAPEKAAKRGLLERVFGTTSWTKISDATHSDRLRKGLAELRAMLRPSPETVFGEGSAAAAAELAERQVAAAATPAMEAEASPTTAPAANGKGGRGRRTANPPPHPPAARPSLPISQPSAPTSPSTVEAADLLLAQDIRELGLTIAALGDNPGWIPGVEERIRRLPDGMDRAKLWQAFRAAKERVELETAAAEAAARALP